MPPPNDPSLPSSWQIPNREPEVEQSLSDALGISRVLAAILAARGVRTPEAAESFFDPRLERLEDPRTLPDFEAAAAEILRAREQKDLIYLHGDYDVDGVTSAALFTRFLGKIGCEVRPHVPHRLKEGYGIHMQAVRDAADSGAKLFLTSDCGVSAHDQVAAAHEAGMRVVVTDHHTVGEAIPSAEAVVNPHRADSSYGFDELCGCGVVLKLCAGITAELGHPVDKFYRAYLDLAVLGTVADVMPLVGENRIITHAGLPLLRATKKPGLRALIQVADLEGLAQFTPSTIGYQLGPRLNAAGRIDDAALSLQLLICQEEAEAARLAQTLEALNRKRREDQNHVIERAAEQIDGQGLASRNVIVIMDRDWHPGIIGIVAGKLVEKYGRPVFVGTTDEITGKAKFSGRSIPAFHLADAIRAHPDLVSGGGHAMAAGFSADPAHLEAVAQAFDQFGARNLTPADFARVVRADVHAQPGEFGPNLTHEFKRMAPFGSGNPAPKLFLAGVSIREVRPTAKPEHVRVTLDVHGQTVGPLPAFGLGPRIQQLTPGQELEVLLEFELGEWQGRERLGWILRDFRVPSSSDGLREG